MSLRVLWRDTEGNVSIWIVDPSLSLISSRVYGPYFGFDPTGAAARKSAQSGGNQQADTAAAGSGTGTPMPKR